MRAPNVRAHQGFLSRGPVPFADRRSEDNHGVPHRHAIGTEETETDLFGEQAVLCGGTAALVRAGFETLVANGYQPEIAYFECLHELKLIVDLMYRGGLNFMRHSVSDTAEFGDYTAGDRIVTAETRQTMQALLDEVKDGTFARRSIDENRTGRPWFDARRAAESDQQMETVGRAMRRMMPFLDAREMLPGQRGSSAPNATAQADGDLAPAAELAGAGVAQ